MSNNRLAEVLQAFALQRMEEERKRREAWEKMKKAHEENPDLVHDVMREAVKQCYICGARL